MPAACNTRAAAAITRCPDRSGSLFVKPWSDRTGDAPPRQEGTPIDARELFLIDSHTVQVSHSGTQKCKPTHWEVEFVFTFIDRSRRKRNLERLKTQQQRFHLLTNRAAAVALALAAVCVLVESAAALDLDGLIELAGRKPGLVVALEPDDLDGLATGQETQCLVDVLLRDAGAVRAARTAACCAWSGNEQKRRRCNESSGAGSSDDHSAVTTTV